MPQQNRPKSGRPDDHIPKKHAETKHFKLHPVFNRQSPLCFLLRRLCFIESILRKREDSTDREGVPLIYRQSGM
jgi:hypothetical protein